MYCRKVKYIKVFEEMLSASCIHKHSQTTIWGALPHIALWGDYCPHWTSTAAFFYALDEIKLIDQIVKISAFDNVLYFNSWLVIMDAWHLVQDLMSYMK